MNAILTRRILPALLLALGGCASAPSDPTPIDDAATSFQGDVTYTLDMHQDQLSSDGGGWSLVNDLGVRFDIQHGGFVLQNLQLTTCDPLHRGHQHGQWTRWLGIGPAYAGHGGPQDPSAVTIPRYLSATSNVPVPLSLSSEADGLYCGVHFLVGRLRGQVAEGPSAPDEVQGHSLWLKGTWRPPGTETDIAFELQATEAFGTRIELFEAMPSHLNGSFSSVRISGSVDRSTWFNGVHPQKMDQRAMRRVVLRNVVESVQWTGTPTAVIPDPSTN